MHLFFIVPEKLIYISLNVGILIKNSFVWYQCVWRETRYIDFSSYTIALNDIISFLRGMIFLPKDSRTSLTSRGNALISLNRLNAVCTWGMRLFLFACRLHSTWHEWLHGSRCYIRPPETKVKAKSNPNWKRTVINVSRFDVGNKAAAVVARAFTLMGKFYACLNHKIFPWKIFL